MTDFRHAYISTLHIWLARQRLATAAQFED